MKTIAVVEDNADNRLLMEAILEDIYRVRCYCDGQEALLAFRKERPDLVLMDISLPEMDGTQVLMLMREDSNLRGIPVIALTAHAMAGDRGKFISDGFDEYVAKPIVDESLLLDAIRRLLAGVPGGGGVPEAVP